MLEMLLYENFLKSVVDHMKVADIFDSLLFQWNCKQKCFQLKSGRKQKVYQYKFFTSFLFGVLVFLQTLWSWNNSNMFAKINSLFFIFILFTFCYFHIFYRSNTPLIFPSWMQCWCLKIAEKVIFKYNHTNWVHYFWTQLLVSTLACRIPHCQFFGRNCQSS